MVVRNQPCLGPRTDGFEILVEGGSNGDAVTVGGDWGPKGAVVGEDVELVLNDVEKVVDEAEEEDGGKHTSLGNSGGHGGELRRTGAHDHALSSTRQKTLQPAKKRTRDTEAFKLEDEPFVPNPVEGFGDIQCDGSYFSTVLEHVRPALGEIDEEIERGVARTEAELLWV